MTTLTLFSPSGVVAEPAALKRAAKRLSANGFQVQVDNAALAKHQRFAGDDATRLAAIHRVAQIAPSVAMASRGGYGLTRLLDGIDWEKVAHSVEQGTRWVGHSDFTAFQLALLAHAPHPELGRSWAGPMACFDFGREADKDHGTKTVAAVDDITEACFLEAMSGELEAVGFNEASGKAAKVSFDGLQTKGRLWGGNLSMLTSLLGTPHFPAASRIKGGVLFLEDVNEHPYRVERALLQLHQAGVLDAQKAVLLGQFTEFKKSPLDRGYQLKTAVAHLRSLTKTPVLTGLPFGHVATKLSLPVGAKVELVVQGRAVLMGW
ncbi:MAG: LD-carboxypeptidase [Burkholderiales bacterium]